MRFDPTVFIVNPCAGNGSTGNSWPHIRSLARRRLGGFETALTRRPGDAETLTRSALTRSVRRIVCVGGDGTLNEVVNGFMRVDGRVRQQAVLGFIPNGTGCDIVRTAAIPRDSEAAIDAIAAGRDRPIDIGRLTLRGDDGRPVRRYFHNITSFGLGGEVDARVNRTTKAFGPFLSFIYATVMAILAYGKKPVTLLLDDRQVHAEPVWNVVIANGQYHGGGMRVAPSACLDDGLFHVTVIGDLTLMEICRHLPKLYNGRILEIEKVTAYTASALAAVSPGRVLLDVDGEQIGALPLAAELEPGAIRLITPA